MCTAAGVSLETDYHVARVRHHTMISGICVHPPIDVRVRRYILAAPYVCGSRRPARLRANHITLAPSSHTRARARAPPTTGTGSAAGKLSSRRRPSALLMRPWSTKPTNIIRYMSDSETRAAAGRDLRTTVPRDRAFDPRCIGTADNLANSIANHHKLRPVNVPSP